MSDAEVYLQISQDRMCQQARTQRQHEDCLALRTQLGVTDPWVFIDDDVSAFGGSRRPGYDAMVTQVRDGASRIIVWHVDRLYRQPRKLKRHCASRCVRSLMVVGSELPRIDADRTAGEEASLVAGLCLTNSSSSNAYRPSSTSSSRSTRLICVRPRPA